MRKQDFITYLSNQLQFWHLGNIRSEVSGKLRKYNDRKMQKKSEDQLGTFFQLLPEPVKTAPALESL